MYYEIIRLTDKPDILETAAQWFHKKWGIPYEAYLESMQESLSGQTAVPEWYLALEQEKIIGGMGVIENDFHDRKDLTPNVCADMKEKGIDTLYLVTDHTSFYERYGWEFFCMVQGDDEPELSRMYIHKTKSGSSL